MATRRPESKDRKEEGKKEGKKDKKEKKARTPPREEAPAAPAPRRVSLSSDGDDSSSRPSESSSVKDAPAAVVPEPKDLRKPNEPQSPPRAGKGAKKGRSKKGQPFRCSACGRTFTQQSGLDQHVYWSKTCVAHQFYAHMPEDKHTL